jgi:D-serine deaminase-like pyridoxal phosphate-dependent protein
MNLLRKSYADYLQILKDYEAPYAFVDFDYLDKNIADILQRAGNLKIRIASKSIRSVEVLRYIFSKSSQFEGIMSFTTKETLFLLEQGFDNILLGYPSVNVQELELLAAEIGKGKNVQLMVDRKEHIALLNTIGQKCKQVLPICIDLDMSSKFPGIHFGVMRSAVNSTQSLQELLNTIKQNPFVSLKGLMGYEAQIAGLGDNVKGAALMNTIIGFLKKKSIKELATKTQRMC